MHGRICTGARVGLASVVLAAASVVSGVLAPSAFAGQPILGSGSTFAFPAISAWMADVAKQNLTVNFNPVGSALGRQAFWTAQADFAASDIPFQQTNCPPGSGSCTQELTQVANSHRGFQYMPIVAGGESIPYNLQINGQQFGGLQLDPGALARIFTGDITNWNDPAIQADNPGVALPSQPIQVVVHSEGAGDSYNLSAYLANQEPGTWDAFANANQLNPPDAPTEYWPCGSMACHVGPSAHFVGQNGSDGVINYIASPAGNGSIGYDETAYAVESGMPMASIKNVAGRYVQPGAISVAVALSHATINPDHTEQLGGVYVNPDPRTYPISSYSYMIVPIDTTAPMNTSKGATISAFINYFLCQGQQDALALRYAPLPVNLVELGLGVEQQVPAHVNPAAISGCNNPAITQNWYAANGIGQPQVTGSGPGSSSGNTTTTIGGTTGHPAASAAGQRGQTAGTAGGTGGSRPVAVGTTSHRTATAIRATTGAAQSYGSAATTATPLGSSASVRAAESVKSGQSVGFGRQWGSPAWLVLLVVVVVLALLLGPPLVRLRRPPPGS